MRITDGIFFWLDGTITQSLTDILLQSCVAPGNLQVNIPALPAYQELSERFMLGKLSDLDFCRYITEKAGMQVKPEVLKQKILSGFLPAPETLSAIRLLPDQFQRWLIVAFPQEWFDQIAGRLDLWSCFPQERVINLADGNLNRLIPEIFDYLPVRAALPADKCLLVDADPKRTICAVDHRFPSAIYVDARRLEREFVMRRFLPTAVPDHKPPSQK